MSEESTMKKKKKEFVYERKTMNGENKWGGGVAERSACRCGVHMVQGS